MLPTVKNALLMAAGVLSLGLGLIGAFLPLLPTVPLILLSAYCFARSSDRLHNWLLTHPTFGKIVRDFEVNRGVPRRIKLRAISLMWLSMGLSGWLVGRPMVWAILALTGCSVSFYLWRLPEPLPAGRQPASRR